MAEMTRSITASIHATMQLLCSTSTSDESFAAAAAAAAAAVPRFGELDAHTLPGKLGSVHLFQRRAGVGLLLEKS